MTPIEKAIQLQKQFAELVKLEDTIDALWEISTEGLDEDDRAKADKWIKKLNKKARKAIYERSRKMEEEAKRLNSEERRAENIRWKEKYFKDKESDKSRKDQEQIPM